MAGKRRWFQFHLSTACLVMLVAAGLVWANVKGLGDYSSPSDEITKRVAYGWPSDFFHYKEGRYMDGRPFRSSRVFDGDRLMEDILTALAILAATAFGCEWWVRRRERRREAPG